MASVIERHPMKQRIVDGILSGEALRSIANSVTPRVSHVAIQRYKATVVGPTMQGASALSQALQSIASGQKPEVQLDAKQITAAALAADPFLARIAQHQETIDLALKDAQTDKDSRGIASLIGTDLKGIELHARLTGRLDAPQASTTSTLFVVLPGISPQVQQLQATDVEFTPLPSGTPDQK